LPEALANNKELENISEKLDGITKNSKEEKINSALNGTRRLLKKLGDKDSELNQSLSGFGENFLKKVFFRTSLQGI